MLWPKDEPNTKENILLPATIDLFLSQIPFSPKICVPKSESREPDPSIRRHSLLPPNFNPSPLVFLPATGIRAVSLPHSLSLSLSRSVPKTAPPPDVAVTGQRQSLSPYRDRVDVAVFHRRNRSSPALVLPSCLEEGAAVAASQPDEDLYPYLLLIAHLLSCGRKTAVVSIFGKVLNIFGPSLVLFSNSRLVELVVGWA
ncbi:hypothetical protein AAHA92_06597 [Salvia divinorum]|uniref:Uncharacterized protein n=1 Tax=Salvia divinorum TaxID=28513 RepID=A0ABD1I8H9_SALDI